MTKINVRHHTMKLKFRLLAIMAALGAYDRLFRGADNNTA